MKSLRQLGMAAVLCLLPLGAGGCLLVAATGAAVGTVSYMSGDLNAMVEANTDQTVAAAKMAMQDLSMPVLSSYSAGMQGEVQGRIGTDNKAIVKVWGQGDKNSKLSIRVGTFGDEAISRNLLEKIQLHIKAPAQAAASVE